MSDLDPMHRKERLTGTCTPIKLQIWRPIVEAEKDYHYMLVWEKCINVDLTSDLGLLYTVSTIVSSHSLYPQV